MHALFFGGRFISTQCESHALCWCYTLFLALRDPLAPLAQYLQVPLGPLVDLNCPLVLQDLCLAPQAPQDLLEAPQVR